MGKENKRAITTKQLTLTALLLAICIVSQFFKNASVYITGPVINTALILAAVYCGGMCAVILSIITPVTAFFITGAPIMAMVPLMFPCIMLGNIVLVDCVLFLKKRLCIGGVPVGGMIIGSVLKGAFMGGVISMLLLPMVMPSLPEKMQAMLPMLQLQFSLTQLITALIGSAVAAIIMKLPIAAIRDAE